jgi:predicted ATPase
MDPLKPNKIVLTGGPGAGKTTAAALLRRELGEQIVIVPEAATMLFMGGFPREKTPHAIEGTQKAIYHVQKNLEEVQAARFPDRTLLCDRGTLDSSIYWPSGPEHCFTTLNTSLKHELGRYHDVVFFETAAVGQVNIIEDGNPTRSETTEQAIELNENLKKIWQKHPNFHFIGHEASFMKKIIAAHQCIMKIMSGY